MASSAERSGFITMMGTDTSVWRSITLIHVRHSQALLIERQQLQAHQHRAVARGLTMAIMRTAGFTRLRK